MLLFLRFLAHGIPFFPGVARTCSGYLVFPDEGRAGFGGFGARIRPLGKSNNWFAVGGVMLQSGQMVSRLPGQHLYSKARRGFKLAWLFCFRTLITPPSVGHACLAALAGFYDPKHDCEDCAKRNNCLYVHGRHLPSKGLPGCETPFPAYRTTFQRNAKGMRKKARAGCCRAVCLVLLAGYGVLFDGARCYNIALTGMLQCA